jgi:hypothetical protein
MSEPNSESVDRLLDEGLVMLINQAILWPRGLALRVWLDDDTGKAHGMDVWEAGEYVAGFIDDPEDDERLVARVRALRAAELEREAVFTARTDAGTPAE